MAEMWFELLAAWFGILVGFTVIIGVFFTFLRALGAVRREDIARLEAGIAEVKALQREDTARLEAKIDANAIATNAKLDAKIDSAIKSINDKFDRYLFGKMAKTDNWPK